MTTDTDTDTADDSTDGRTCATCGEPLPTIVDLVTHGCEALLSADDLTRKERNTLMYVEVRVVDHGGVLDWAQMNYEDRQNLKVFHAAGVLETEDSPHDDTMEVTAFTNRAWDLARDCRQLRAGQRMDAEAVGLEGDADAADA